MSNEATKIHLCAIGSPDFCRRIGAVTAQHRLCGSFHQGMLTEAWGLILTHRPNAVVFEIGAHYSARQHSWLRRTLQNLHERHGEEIFVIAALTSCEKFFYGGDLLFKSSSDLSPSEWIDAFVVSPPSHLPSLPGVAEQIQNVLSLYKMELRRRSDSQIALPRLGHPSWVQSLGDPQSRELWMRWLPRYASYVNESPIIIGETGTGKTRLAFALHILSGRKGDFVSITPRDFSSSELVQAELFGAVAGAYTGAVDKWGLVKGAEHGTLFIDELQSIDKDLQGKLITFIENKVYRRVGSAEQIEADVRFVFASNKSIPEMIAADILREDFAYRLERVQLELLPLKGRRLDIPPALAFALAKIQRQRPKSREVYGFKPDAYRKLLSYDWPGNLRQLENMTAQLCELADIEERDLIDETIVARVIGAKIVEAPTNLREVIAACALELSAELLTGNSLSLDEATEWLAERVRVKTIETCGGDLERAATLLGEQEQFLELSTQALIAKQEADYLQ